MIGRRSMRGPRRLLWAAALLGAGIVVLVAATEPRASELKYESKSKTVHSTLPNVNGRGQVEITCPASHPHPTGGGVKITGDNSDLELAVASTNPNGAPPHGWLAEADNRSGSDAQMTITAICAKGRFSNPLHSQNIGPGGQATKRVACPSGTKVSGGGVSTEGDSPQVAVAVSRPFDSPDAGSTPDDGWIGSANNGTSSRLTMAVFAVCADSGQFRYTHSAPNALPNNADASARAGCPPGTTITGGGVENSGADVGAEIVGSFPVGDQEWVGRASNDNTGQAETVQAFAVCRVSEIRKFTGSVGGGTVTFNARFEGGQAVKVLKGAAFADIPIHCSNRDTTHTVIIDGSPRVRNDNFRASTDSEVGQPGAAFSLSGHFNNRGTLASGTYRERGNLRSGNGTFVFTNCDTGSLHWSAQVR